MPVSPRREIGRFLKTFFKYWQPHCIFRPRAKNRDALLELGLTPKHREEIVMNLGSRDCFSGPKEAEDSMRHGRGQVLELGVNSEGVEIYIKLRISNENPESVVATCISFHRAERAIKYPYKENH